VSALAPVFAQSSKIAQTEILLEPSPLQPPFHDQFGTTVAASANGNTLAVSAITNDVGTVSEAGSIFIYDRVQGNWMQTARLTASDAQEDNALGISLAISEDGNTVVAGPTGHTVTIPGQGAVYVFHRVNGVWTQEAELLSPTPASQSGFGFWGVAISGDTIAAGDLGGRASNFISGVDVFTRVNGVWQLSTVIELPDDFDFSPTGVALSGGTLVVMNTGGNFGNGVAYIFGVVNGKWVLQAKLSPSELTSGSAFGNSADISGDTVVIGAPSAPGVSPFSGAAYVFVRRGETWVQSAKLTGADGVSGDGFGSAVSIQGGTIAAGSGHTTSAGFRAGTVYLFHLSDSQWTQFAELAGSDVAAGGGFGGSVGYRNGTLLVGAPLQHPQPNNAPYPEGEAYIYNVN
jgi:hypothetical protein